MSKKKNGTTVNGIRIYRCKMCGKEVRINTYLWKKRPQEYKKVCDNCVPKDASSFPRPYRPYTADLYPPISLRY